MAIGRRIITRSVSATGAATLHQPQPPAHHVPTKPSTSHDKTRITASKKATLLNLPQRRIMKRQSSTDLDETYMHSASSPKRLRSDDVSGEQEQEERSEGMNPEPIPPEPQNAGPSMSNGSTEPSVPTLKRSRGEEEHGSSPRKRQAFDHVPPATPAAQASSSKPPRLPKSRSLPKMPTVFTPARPRSGSDAETITMKRSSLDSVCGDAVLPLEHQGEGGGITPKHPPAAHGEFNPKFTFNPFVVGMQDTKADALPKKPSGDAFGPAVPSLSRLLTVTETPRAPSGTVQDLQVQDEVPLPPSPTKASLPSKPRPSMIPRLVLAPPPAPAPKPAPPKPSPTKFSRFFASPVKPTAPLQRSASALARVPPPPRPSGKALASKRESMLSVEAQASLANLSEALQKLSMPPTRTSIGSSSSEDTLVGTSPRSTNEDDGQEDSTRQANLPPRPSTSLGLHARSGSLATEPGNPRRPAQPGKKPHTGLFPSAPRASVAPTTGSVKAGNDPASKAAPAVDASNDRSKDKGKQRAPLATIGGAPIDIVPTSDCLQGCVIFVDVRTDDGADASSMFIQMLRQLSAKIITRPGKTATHIVWKSGSQATLSRYSSMEQPRPFLVGVGWVVQCVDKKTRVDEKRFLVDLKEAESVFGGMVRIPIQDMEVFDSSSPDT
ncbi:hypothetical protein FRB99_008881 [Tulasnella sp. 403]|nr:hypothetical protein FRB99_008881 [Tulasnella sp. 403]